MHLCLQQTESRQAVQRQSKAVRGAVLQRAQVVACTLSAAGGELAALLPPDAKFDALIVDEVRCVQTPGSHPLESVAGPLRCNCQACKR